MPADAGMTETRQLDFDGHRLAYRVSGEGPALVVLSLYRRRADVPQARLLSDRWRVFQIHPLGFGYSERVPGYAGEALADAQMRRMDRRLRPDHPSRTLWEWVMGFDWGEELRRMPCPSLLYWGSEDRSHAPGLRRARKSLGGHDIDFVEYPGLGHEAGGEPQHVADSVVPMVVDWTTRRVGPTW